jgi:hypothetical protein
MTRTTRWLRLEGAALLLALLAVYATAGLSWLLFAALILVPDLSMLAYIAGPRAGATVYNLAHVYLWPALLLGAWAVSGVTWALGPGLVWGAHIAMDRALGYGLKEPSSFQATHLGRIGKTRGSS